MSDIKLVVKCGDIEVSYEGSEEFLKKELPDLIKGIAHLRAQGAKSTAGTGSALASSTSGEKSNTATSVSTVAQKLSVSKGTELIMAAAYILAPSGAFTKKQLREGSRDATTYWKGSYANNFDNYVARLVKKGRLNHVGGENYALPEKEQVAIAAKVNT